MRYIKEIVLIIIFLISGCEYTIASDNNSIDAATDDLNIKKVILMHIADKYEWTIWRDGKMDITIPLPVILRSKQSGWHCFSSAKLRQSSYKGFYVATTGKYEGKIVEQNSQGNEIRPFDLSLTKNALSIIIGSIIIVWIFLSVTNSIANDPLSAKGGFVGMMESFITRIEERVIVPAVGKDYMLFAPYLLTVFFFIFFTNLAGLIPFFPGGANVTGNIAVTMVLALGTFFVINCNGTRNYYKNLLWPNVPLFLKFPLPLMQGIETIGLFTKPFALMIRLFANIMGGHCVILGLTSLVFITVKMGMAINTFGIIMAVFFIVFMDFIEILVAFLQAYVFTLLSAIFMGQART